MARQRKCRIYRGELGISFYFVFCACFLSNAVALLIIALANDDKSPAENTLIEGHFLPRQQAIVPVNPPDLPDPGPVPGAIMRRGPGGPWDDGPYTYYCGVFHTGKTDTARQGARSLRAENVSYAAPPGGDCLRVYCFETTAVYVCNDTPDLLAVPGFNIGWMAERLTSLCCDARHGLSAQLFHPTDGWNTVVAYGNCRHGADEPPAAFGVGNGGVNGACVAAPKKKEKS